MAQIQIVFQLHLASRVLLPRIALENTEAIHSGVQRERERER